jgi:hypothetical protein
MTNSKKLKVIGLIITSQLYMGCNSTDFGSKNQIATANSTAQSASGLASSVSLSIYNQGTNTGAPLYSDASGSGQQITLTAGSQYNFHINASNLPSGAAVNLQMQDIDIVNGPKTNTPLAVGDNNVTAPVGGDWNFTLQVSNGSSGISSRSYQAIVSCTNSNFSSASLSAAGISVTAGSGSNLYNFSAAGVVANNNGQAPYLCAYDLSGVGITSTQFLPCGTALTNVYVNLVGNREVGVIVKDACNKTGEVSVPAPGANLAYTVPASGVQNNFIFGQVTNASGNAIDPRVGGATYLATNSGGVSPVQANTGGANDSKTGSEITVTSFSETATYSYASMTNGQPSSVPYGMTINIGNIGGNFNLQTSTGASTGTLNFANATMNIGYSTDQAGDQAPALLFQSTSCTPSNLQYTIVPFTPFVCTNEDGSPGMNYSASVEIWGNYTCNVTDASGAATITGSFDGTHQLVDGCVGNTEATGGSPPVSF